MHGKEESVQATSCGLGTDHFKKESHRFNHLIILDSGLEQRTHAGPPKTAIPESRENTFPTQFDPSATNVHPYGASAGHGGLLLRRAIGGLTGRLSPITSQEF